jgi:hypothetical protein
MKISRFGPACMVVLALAAGTATAADHQLAAEEAGVVPGSAGKDFLKNNPQAASTVAPQSIMVESSLMSTKAQLDGLKSQLQIAQGKPDAVFMNQVNTFSKNIDSGIKDASTHAGKLRTTVEKSYPQIAGADDLKNLDYSVNDLSSFYKSWAAKAKDRAYWQDKQMAEGDIEALDKRIDKAIDQSKTFNANQLDLSIG